MAWRHGAPWPEESFAGRSFDSMALSRQEMLDGLREQAAHLEDELQSIQEQIEQLENTGTRKK